jgi:arsenate reductase
MAEGLLRSLGGNEYEVYSAGTHPSFVRPQAIQVMTEIEIDISSRYSKSLGQFVNEDFDFVITVCDNAKEICPFFHGAKQMLHWSIEDPVRIWGSEEVQLQAFREARDELKKRVMKTFRLSSRRPMGEQPPEDQENSTC